MTMISQSLPHFPRYNLTAKQWLDAIHAGFTILRGSAARRSTMTYRAWSTELCAHTGIAIARPGWASLLEDISAVSYADRGVLITALVVNQDTGEPGTGFEEMRARMQVDPALATAEAAWRAYSVADLLKPEP